MNEAAQAKTNPPQAREIVAAASGHLSVEAGVAGDVAPATEAKPKKPRRTDYPSYSAEDVIRIVVECIGEGKLVKNPEGGPDILPYDVLREKLNWPDDGEARAVLRQRYNNYRDGKRGMEAISNLPPLDRKAHTGGINTRTDSAQLNEMLAAALGQAVSTNTAA